MFRTVHVRFAENQKNNNEALVTELGSTLRSGAGGPVFIIGSWQSGDFSHIYAAAVRHFSLSPQIPFGMLVIQGEGSGTALLINDIRFAFELLCKQMGVNFTLYHTDAISQKRAAASVIPALMRADNAREPYDATFWASEAVKSMRQGQPLTEVWAALVRGASKEHFDDYSRVCESFMREYVDRFGMSSGRERFVCLWGRTSGAPTSTRKLGGANPQYDSSERGNHQLCLAIKEGIPGLKAIFTVGDGFHAATTSLPFVFNLGAFWKRMSFIKGRFQENGFFDFMTAFYDCDVVHVGMKSGGMDTLGIWGQKVVFIDSMRSPQVTQARVAAWSSSTILPVPISSMPTALGKAIELAREKDERAFKTTFSAPKQVAEMEKLARQHELDDKFKDEDLAKVVTAVKRMFG